MGKQLGLHFPKQPIPQRTTRAVRDTVEQRRDLLVVVVQVLKDTLCDTEHFFYHRISPFASNGIVK
jgi:hypothetical protein